MRLMSGVGGLPNWIARLSLCIVLSAAGTWWAIEQSRLHGRLLYPPQYDDVVYFVDGLERLQTLQQDGWWPLLQSFGQHPPHAPFSTLVALASFGIFGVHEWAPYVGDSIILFAFIAFSDWLLRGSKWWVHCAGLALVCSVPLSLHMVSNFRPDFAESLAIAAGTVLLVTRPLGTTSRTSTLWLGLILGLALTIKPAMALFALGMLGGSWCLSALCTRRFENQAWAPMLRQGGVVVLIAVVVAGPYYLCGWKDVAEYVHTVLWSRQAKFYAAPGNRWNHWLFYISGMGATHMLSQLTGPLAGLAGAGVLATALSRNRAATARMMGLGCMIFCAWIVPTLAAVKVSSFGATLAFLLIFAALLSLRSLTERPCPRWLGWSAAVGIPLWFVPALSWPCMTPTQVIETTQARELRETGEQIVNLIGSRRLHQAHVFMTCEALNLNACTFNWVARRRHQPIQVNGPMQTEDLGWYRTHMEKSHFVIACQRPPERYPLASEKLASATLALARSLSDLREVQSFATRGGSVVYHLFENVRLVHWPNGARDPAAPAFASQSQPMAMTGSASSAR